jgi:hypothetical protein
MEVASVETKPMLDTMHVVYVFRKMDQFRAFPGCEFQSRRTVKSELGCARMSWGGVDIAWFGNRGCFCALVDKGLLGGEDELDSEVFEDIWLLSEFMVGEHGQLYPTLRTSFGKLYVTYQQATCYNVTAAYE